MSRSKLICLIWGLRAKSHRAALMCWPLTAQAVPSPRRRPQGASYAALRNELVCTRNDSYRKPAPPLCTPRHSCLCTEICLAGRQRFASGTSKHVSLIQKSVCLLCHSQSDYLSNAARPLPSIRQHYVCSQKKKTKNYVRVAQIDTELNAGHSYLCNQLCRNL